MNRKKEVNKRLRKLCNDAQISGHDISLKTGRKSCNYYSFLVGNLDYSTDKCYEIAEKLGIKL